MDWSINHSDPASVWCMILSCYVGQQCPAGRFGNQTGLAALTDCPLCSSGWYCPVPGATKPHAECTAGHYCKLGATSATPDGESWGYKCPSGHYCPQGTPTPQPCDKGTYQPMEGMCIRSVLWSDFDFCQMKHLKCYIPGTICRLSDRLHGMRCLLSLCDCHILMLIVGKAAAADCVACDAGEYCQNSGMTNTSGPCDAGYYCTRRSKFPNPTGIYT